ncbi:MAG TPA: ATP-binding protein, partial [Tepidisphaeraceae bacterium]
MAIRRVQVLVLFAIAMIISGMTLVVPDGVGKLPTWAGEKSVNTAAAVLVVLGGVGGLLATRHLRTICGDLSRQVIARQRTGEMTPVRASDHALAPLAGSINNLLQSVQSQLADARRHNQELEIQLKVVQIEREHAQSIIHSISDAVLVTDPWDELVTANDAAARTLGFRMPEQGRRPVAELIKDARIIAMICEMRATRSANGRRTVEHPIGDRTFKVTLSCLPGSGEGGGGVVAVLRDMTREAEVAQMKNDFVSHVSHELRTPLASIKAYVEMLVDGEAQDEKQKSEFYEVIQNEANRLGRLIDNILDISRIESGLVKVNKQALSVTVVVKEALELITPQASGKNIRIVDQVAPAMYQAMADKDTFHRAVLNLLSNAVKYTPAGGTITAATSVDEAAKRITIRISDTGVGIPPKDLPFVFDKFYRVEANKGMAKGTGLGLSLVKHIVENVHHGRVFVESTVGVGSSFGIELD